MTWSGPPPRWTTPSVASAGALPTETTTARRKPSTSIGESRPSRPPSDPKPLPTMSVNSPVIPRSASQAATTAVHGLHLPQGERRSEELPSVGPPDPAPRFPPGPPYARTRAVSRRRSLRPAPCPFCRTGTAFRAHVAWPAVGCRSARPLRRSPPAREHPRHSVPRDAFEARRRRPGDLQLRYPPKPTRWPRRSCRSDWSSAARHRWNGPPVRSHSPGHSVDCAPSMSAGSMHTASVCTLQHEQLGSPVRSEIRARHQWCERPTCRQR